MGAGTCMFIARYIYILHLIHHGHAANEKYQTDSYTLDDDDSMNDPDNLMSDIYMCKSSK